MSLDTSIGRIKLNTPLLLASGYITETAEFFLKAKNYGCSGMVTRSLKKKCSLRTYACSISSLCSI